ncbi:cell wall-binding repeat-containing protein [Intrasporangium sp. DVR]|uniref:cell wall-binding repeat-containing protein n=1 Tax=Intrasporangium sp. DVR TaxID=3127867 RepID=UPI00313A60EB
MRERTRARRAISGTTVGVLAAAGLGLAAPLAGAATVVDKVRASDIVAWDVTSNEPAPTGWFAQDDDQIGAGSYELVEGSDGSDGDGTLRLVAPTGADKATVKKATAAGTKLADVTAGGYRVRTTTGAAPSYQLVIDCNGGTLADGGFATLNHIPTQVPADGWKTWDTVDGGQATYWATRYILSDGTTSNTVPAPGGPTVVINRWESKPLADFQAACATGLALTYGVSVGRDEAHDAEVDHVVLNDSETNFQRVMIDRFAGADRVATAVEASQGLWADQAASSAAIATAATFADGLAGGPLAVAAGGPLLLNNASFLDGRVSDELERVLAPGSRVYVLGGTAALSSDVSSAISSLGFTVVRLAGADRYATAVEIADELGTPDAIFLTSGTNFPDALSASPAAVREVGVLLLTRDTSMTSATAAYLADHPTATRYAIGGPAATAAGPLVLPANRLVGINRFDTAVRTAQRFFDGNDVVTFASGRAFPDALGGGAFAGTVDAPMLLVDTTAVPGVLATYLEDQRLAIEVGALFGGPVAVSADVADALTGILN